MANNWNEFVTNVKLNTSEAENRLKTLKQKTDDLIKQRDKLINGGSSKTQVNALQKQINQNEKSMRQLEKQATNVIDVINNMDSSSLVQLQQAQRMLNAEMQKTPQNTEYFKQLNEKLQSVKTSIAGIRAESKENYTEMSQARTAAQNLSNVLGNLNTSSMKELTAAAAEAKRQMSETKPNTNEYEKAAASLKTIQTRITEINRSQQQVNTAIDRYNDEIKRVAKDTEKTRQETDLIDKTLKNLSTANIREMEYTVQVLNEKLRETPRATVEYQRLEEQIRRVKTQLAAVGREQEAVTGKWSRFMNMLNKNWGAFTQIIASFSGLTMTIRKCVSDFAEMDEAMTNVMKYTGQTKEEVKSMNEDFKRIDTRTSREQLNELAGAAGRLGITSKSSIEEFVDAADKINVALGDDLGQGAVDQIGKLAMAFGEDDKMGLRGAMLATGSALNELAQNSSANAGYLVDFTARVAGVAKQLGLTQAQIMGFGAVMDENMQKDEMASTAFSQLLTKMATDTDKFAKMAGKSTGEFAKMMKTDVNGAVITLMENLKKSGGFSELAKIFNDMQLDGTRCVQVLSTMADKVDDIKTRQQVATQAYASGTSVLNEFNNANSSAQAELDKAKKKFQELTIELGEKLMPVARYGITTTSLLVKGLSLLTDIVTKYRGTIIRLAVTIVTINTLMNLNNILFRVHYYWVTICQKAEKGYAATVVLLRSSLVALHAVVALLTKGVQGYIAVMRAAKIANMTNPWTALATVLSVVGIAIYGIVKAARESAKALEVQSKASILASMRTRDLASVQDEAAKSAVAQKEKVQQLTKIVEDNTKKTKDRMDAAKQLQNIVPGYFATLDTEGAKYRSNTKAITDYIAMLDQVALARAINKKLEENAAKQIDEAKAIDAWEKGIAKRNKIIKNQKEEMRKAASETHWYDTWDNGMAARGELALNHAAVDKSKSQLEYDKARLKVHQNINKALQEENKWLRDYLNKNVSTEAQLMAINDKDFGNSFGNDTSVNGKSGKTGSGKVSSNTTPKEAPATRLKNQLDHELALEEQSYQQGDITYKTYLADKEALQTAYYEKLKALYKKDSDEYNKVCDEQAKTLADTMGEIRKDTEEGYERERQTVAAKLMAVFYDPTAEAFQNQQQLDEALFKNEMHYYDQRLTLYKEGTKEFERIQAERDAKDEERRQKRQQEWLESYNRFKGQFRKQSLAEQEAEQKATIKAGLDYIVSVYKEKMKSLDKDSAEYKRLEAELEALKAEYEQWLADTETEYARKRNEERSNQAQDNKEMSDAAARGFDKAGLSDNPVASPNGFTGTQGIIGVAGTIGTALRAYAKLREAKKKNLIDDQEWADAKEQLWKNLWNNLPDMAKAAWDTIQTFGQADVAYTQANCDYKVAMISKEYEQRINKAGNNSAKVEKLEKERDKKIAAEKNKANKKAMRMEIAQATVQTAEAAISAYKSAAAIPMVGHILAPIAAAAALAYGAMQVATIKKQHQAETAGYYEGGFTGGSDFRRRAGIVHEGEFVANHQTLENPNVMPVLQLIDHAQRTNTVGSLTANDVTRQLGQGGSAVVAPVVNVSNDNSELADTMDQARDTMDKLDKRLEDGIKVLFSMEYFKKEERRWDKMQNNK